MLLLSSLLPGCGVNFVSVAEYEAVLAERDMYKQLYENELNGVGEPLPEMEEEAVATEEPTENAVQEPVYDNEAEPSVDSPEDEGAADDTVEEGGEVVEEEPLPDDGNAEEESASDNSANAEEALSDNSADAEEAVSDNSAEENAAEDNTGEESEEKTESPAVSENASDAGESAEAKISYHPNAAIDNLFKNYNASTKDKPIVPELINGGEGGQENKAAVSVYGTYISIEAKGNNEIVVAIENTKSGNNDDVRAMYYGFAKALVPTLTNEELSAMWSELATHQYKSIFGNQSMNYKKIHSAYAITASPDVRFHADIDYSDSFSSATRTLETEMRGSSSSTYSSSTSQSTSSSSSSSK